MSYTKTQWVNNTTPINDTNLNKMEQGIYDNSLVTDAVTNTLNPTDTETYKTAELTEGQIIDVIGVSDILIKGQTSQDGTPTPSAPVDVNVVSGSNVINTSNKNLLSINNGTFTSVYNFNANVQNGTIVVNGTPSSTPGLLRITLSQPIKLKQNDSIKINVNNSNGIGTSSNYVAFRLVGIVNGVSNDNITEVMCTNANANKTFTATNDTIINQIVIRGNSNVTFNNFIIKPQIELGTTTTTYEPHQGKELPLDLPVENLLNLTDGTYTHNGITAVVNKGIITLNGTANGTSAVNIPTSITLKANTSYTIGANNLNVIGKGGTAEPYACIRLRMSDTDDATTDVRFSSVNNYRTIQKSADTTYAFLRIRTASTLTYNNFVIKPQIELGIKFNAYTPYGTEPIELCKIGNYRDYFYKSGSKWYLHKEVERIILNGSEEWSFINNCLQSTNELPNNIITIDTNLNALSNHFVYHYYPTGITNSIQVGEFGWNSSKKVTFKIENLTTKQAYLDWLASNNVSIHYPLATATDTEITNTILISQLEAIYNAPLYEQTNITQENNDLPMVLDITACKDNINGIKAFIRK